LQLRFPRGCSLLTHTPTDMCRHGCARCKGTRAGRDHPGKAWLARAAWLQAQSKCTWNRYLALPMSAYVPALHLQKEGLLVCVFIFASLLRSVCHCSISLLAGLPDTQIKTLQCRCGRSRRKKRILGRRAHIMKFPLYAGSTRLFTEV